MSRPGRATEPLPAETLNVEARAMPAPLLPVGSSDDIDVTPADRLGWLAAPSAAERRLTEALEDFRRRRGTLPTWGDVLAAARALAFGRGS
jgi:hypothetical protein